MTDEISYCTRCKTHKLATEFHRHLTGRASRCRKCLSELYRAQNADPAIKLARIEKHKKMAEQRKLHREQVRLEKLRLKAQQKAERKAELERLRLARARPVARPPRKVKPVVIAKPSWKPSWSLSLDWIEQQREKQRNECALCDNDLQFYATNWITPATAGGRLLPGNLRLICLPCCAADYHAKFTCQTTP